MMHYNKNEIMEIPKSWIPLYLLSTFSQYDRLLIITTILNMFVLSYVIFFFVIYWFTIIHHYFFLFPLYFPARKRDICHEEEWESQVDRLWSGSVRKPRQTRACFVWFSWVLCPGGSWPQTRQFLLRHVESWGAGLCTVSRMVFDLVSFCYN